MAKVKIQGNASGTGTVTLTAPNTNNDRTITLPDGTGTLLNSDGDGSSLTGVGVDGISSASSSGTAISIASNNDVGIGTTSPTGFEIRNTSIRISKQASVTAFRILGNDLGNDLAIQSSNTVDGTAYTSRLNIMNDGRGLSQFTAKAWASWNGVGSLAVLDSHNISSIADNGTGNHRVNIDVNMADTNYMVAGSINNSSRGNLAFEAKAVGSVDAESRETDTGTYTDYSAIGLVIFGD